MKKIRFPLAIVATAAAMALPAVAQSTTDATRSSPTRDRSTATTPSMAPRTTPGNTGPVSGTVPGTQTGTSGSAAVPCSALHQPNAGKLADKDTGKAKDHSASPIHQDCVDDPAPTRAQPR